MSGASKYASISGKTRQFRVDRPILATYIQLQTDATEQGSGKGIGHALAALTAPLRYENMNSFINNQLTSPIQAQPSHRFLTLTGTLPMPATSAHSDESPLSVCTQRSSAHTHLTYSRLPNSPSKYNADAYEIPNQHPFSTSL